MISTPATKSGSPLKVAIDPKRMVALGRNDIFMAARKSWQAGNARGDAGSRYRSASA
jgi:hypothetical protein